jgi:hypothetical protein
MDQEGQPAPPTAEEMDDMLNRAFGEFDLDRSG